MSNPSEETWSKGELLQVARGQRRILWLILISLLVSIPIGLMIATASAREFNDVMTIARFVGLGFGVVQLFAVLRLAKALRSTVPFFFCLLAFVPVISLFSLLYLNQNATKVLKAAGINVGFMGARMADFEKLAFSSDECNVCGKSSKAADEVLKCPKCQVQICDSCAVRTRESAGMVESFAITCPRCQTALIEDRTKSAAAEEPEADDFDDETERAPRS